MKRINVVRIFFRIPAGSTDARIKTRIKHKKARQFQLTSPPFGRQLEINQVNDLQINQQFITKKSKDFGLVNRFLSLVSV